MNNIIHPWLIKRFIHRLIVLCLITIWLPEFFVFSSQAMMSGESSSTTISIASPPDTDVSTAEEDDDSKQGLDFYIHYVPGSWRDRQKLRNSIIEKLPSDLKAIASDFVKSSTSMHITMGWGNILPLTCSSPKESETCKFIPISKAPLSEIAKVINQLSNRDGGRIIEELRKFRSFFHRGSRHYFLEHFPLDETETMPQSITLDELRAVTLEIHKAVDVVFNIAELPAFKDPDLTTFDQIITFLHKNIAYLTQEIANNLPRYGSDRVLNELFDYAKDQEEDNKTICKGFIDQISNNQIKVVTPVARAVELIGKILRDKFKGEFQVPKRLASNPKDKDYEKFSVREMTNWDLYLWQESDDTAHAAEQIKRDRKKALRQCTKFLSNAQDLGLIEFFNKFKMSFVTHYSGNKFQFNDSLTPFKGSKNKVLITATVDPKSEHELRLSYRAVLKEFLPKKYLPTKKIPVIDCLTSGLGLDHLTQGDKRDFTKITDLASLNLDKRYCLEGSSENCFMVLAHREFYNGQCPFNYHVTIVSDELAPVKGETSQKDIQNQIRNENLEQLKDALLDTSFTLVSKPLLIDWNELPEVSGDNLHFYNPLVYPLPLVATEVPRVDEEIQDEYVCLWKDTSCTVTPKKKALKKAKSTGQHLVEVESSQYPPVCKIGPIVDRGPSDKLIFRLNKDEDLNTAVMRDTANYHSLDNLISLTKTDSPAIDIEIELLDFNNRKIDPQTYIEDLLHDIPNIEHFVLKAKRGKDPSKIFVTLTAKTTSSPKKTLYINEELQTSFQKNIKDLDQNDTRNLSFINDTIIQPFLDSSDQQMILEITFDDKIDKKSYAKTIGRLKNILSKKDLEVGKNFNRKVDPPHFSLEISKKTVK